MRKLRSCRKGTIAVVSAMALPLLLGFVSLGVEAGHWYLTERQMQGAADAAAISATAQYIQDQIAGNTESSAYQSTGQSYALLNGFTIPIANTCLITPSGDNCNPVRRLDARPILCDPTKTCIVVEITQNTSLWRSTQRSMRSTNQIGRVQPIPTPTLLARSVVTADPPTITTTTTTSRGADCILALANATNAILVRGNADLKAACGISIDGGRDQNISGTPLGGITFSGANSKVNISTLVIAAHSTNCPDGGTHCQIFGSTAPLTNANVVVDTATLNPYAATLSFPTFPSGACVPWTSGGTPIPGQKYCSINLNGAGTTNFAAGSYFIAGGDSSCAGFCVSSANAIVTSDNAGVTFFLTHGDGARASTFATVQMASGTISLCAPGTNSGGTTCTGANPGTTCDKTRGSCMLFVQDPAATPSTSNTGTNTPTVNTFSGNGTRTLSGLVYLPQQTFQETGNGPILGCFGVVAKYLDIGGIPTFSNGCLPGNGIGGTTTTTTTITAGGPPVLSQ